MIRNLQPAILTLLLAAVFACPLVGCRSLPPEDPVREANVKSFNRLVPVIQRVLKVDRAQITMSTKLAQIGVDDSTAIKLKSALEKEFGVEFPAKLFLPTGFVNDLVTYASLTVYKVDTSGTQLDSSSGPVSPEFLDKEKENQKSNNGNPSGSAQNKAQ